MLTFISSIVSAQDIIIMRNGQQIQSKIISIDNKEIQYQLYPSSDNKVITVKTDEIESIRFENGVIQTFESTKTKRSKDETTKQDAASAPVALSEVRDYSFSAAIYFADFDAIDKGNYGVISHNLQDRKIGMSIMMPFMNWGISKNKYSDRYGGGIGANYCYGLSEEACAFAPLMFIGYGYEIPEYNTSTGKTKDKSKFGWGFMLTPSAVYEHGHLAVTAGLNLVWSKGSSKIGTGLMIGVGYAW